MFIDTHCHLTERYSVDAQELINNAKQNNVGALICATAEPHDIQKTLELANANYNIFCTIGLHPDCADTINASDFLTPDILNNEKVVGIGEIGLDYHERDDNRDKQIKLFVDLLEIAQHFDLPVAIHTRDAEDDTAQILTNKNHGVLHCFTSSWDLARTLLDRGFWFSASGILTFKNANDIRDVFAKIPNDRIVIETDSPFCAPVPYRGKTCEPAFVVETAKVLAEIKHLQIDELESILMENTMRLYPKIKLI